MHHLSDKLELRTMSQDGAGVFARGNLEPGELLVVWGGEVVRGDLFRTLPRDLQRHSLQVESNLFLVPHRELEAADFVNHSCDPNAGFAGSSALVARREIWPGDEVCFDYAMSDSDPYDEFDCACGSLLCRGRVTGRDWQRPDLQSRYDGHFSTYLQQRITRKRTAGPRLEARVGAEPAPLRRARG